MSQKLRGFVGQSMSGARKSSTSVSYSYPGGTYSFTVPTSGSYRLVMWGGGGGSNNAGAWSGPSSGYVEAVRSLTTGQVLALVVGVSGDALGGDGTDTTLTLPTGEVLTAGGGLGSTNAGGVATGNAPTGDILINGSVGVASGAGTSGGGTAGGAGGASGGGVAGGAGAPGNGHYHGGKGAAGALNKWGGSPGAGGAINSGNGTGGGEGQVIITQIRRSS